MIELVEDLENYEAIDYDDFGREVVQFMQVSTKVWYFMYSFEFYHFFDILRYNIRLSRKRNLQQDNCRESS